MEIREGRVPFARVDAPVIDEYLPKIGCTALAVYVVLCRHADNNSGLCWPSQERMAEHCKLTERTIRTALSVLEKAGLISVKKTKSDGALYARNVYTILPVTGNTLPVTTLVTGNQLPHATGSQRPPNYTHIELDSNTLSSPSAPSDFVLTSIPTQPSTSRSKHSAFKESIFKCYRYLNEGQDPPWDASDAKILSSLIAAKPDLEPEQFHQWLGFYARSENINPAARPRKFVGDICSYSRGPLNKFGKPMEEE